MYSFRSRYFNRQLSNVSMICEEHKGSRGKVHSTKPFSGGVTWTGSIYSLTKSFDLSAVGTFQAPQPFTALSADYLSSPYAGVQSNPTFMFWFFRSRFRNSHLASSETNRCRLLPLFYARFSTRNIDHKPVLLANENY